MRNVAAEVVFITGTNQIEIDITNLETGIDRIWQTISAIDFTVEGVSANPTGIAFKDTNLKEVVTFANAGTLNAATALTTVANMWTIATSTQLSGTEIGAKHATASSAKDLILGPGSYNANSTMRNGNNNQYLVTPTTGSHIDFVLTYASTAGISADTKITAAHATFGLTFDATDEETLTTQPEIGTIGMMVGGLALIGIGASRRRKP